MDCKSSSAPTSRRPPPSPAGRPGWKLSAVTGLALSRQLEKGLRQQGIRPEVLLEFIRKNRRQLVIDGAKEKLPGVANWYLDKVGYFFTEDDEDGQTHPINPKIVTIYRLDLNRMMFTKGEITLAKLKVLKKMDYEPWNMKPDCG